MKVEILIYAYLAVCTSMIIFNIVCIFVFKKKDRTISKRSLDFTKDIKSQFGKNEIETDHQKFLIKKLKKINNMMAFDETLDQLVVENPKAAQAYIKNLYPAFLELFNEYCKKNDMEIAYFLYIIKKYNLFKGHGIKKIDDVLVELVKDENIYCRENALEALYSIGNPDAVIYALKNLERNGGYYHTKMITDGLLKFQGDRSIFDAKLWRNFDSFGNKMKLSILDYFRFHSGNYSAQFLEIMQDENENDELRYSSIRYFGRYPNQEALSYLYQFAEDNSGKWEYTAIAALALAAYPSQKTEIVLKRLLSSRNWYVRYNAADSLEKLGVDYDRLIDIFEGKDRYASEMLRYKIEQKKMAQKVVKP